MPFTHPGGHDFAHRVNLDGLGRLYISLTVAWTALLISGITFLLMNRNLPILRMRKIWLGITAVLTLHVYWCLCMLAYVCNGYFPCSLEFWLMSTLLPWGIAFYQVNNTQLLCVAGLQKKLATSEPLQNEKLGTAGTGLRQGFDRWSRYNVTTRTMIGLGCGMAVQVLLTFVLFLGSRRMHPSWGAFGEIVGDAKCRQGFEWWPSIAWQLIWSWIYAPYLLWKIRDIKDVHAWRLQTVLCSVAGLPATPLWIASLYSPAFVGVDKYWVPPLWFSPSIVIMEASVTFIPCWQVLKNRTLRKETLEILAEWENKHQKSASTIGSESTTLTMESTVSSKATTTSSGRRATGEMYNMNALETALNTNPTPLLLFAALKDFSGENISFLNHVHGWKASWNPPSKSRSLLTGQQYPRLEGEALRRRQFSIAVEIYSSFVSMQYSDFPINISSANLKELNALFAGPAATINTTVKYDPATLFNRKRSSVKPWDAEHGSQKELVTMTTTTVVDDNDAGDIFTPPQSNHFNPIRRFSLMTLQPRLASSVPIPDAFGPAIFDHAEESIKYMVLTNTWPKFVSAGYADKMQHKTFFAKLKEIMPGSRRPSLKPLTS